MRYYALMDAVDKIAWRAVLRPLLELEAELERVSREMAHRCPAKDAQRHPQELIELGRKTAPGIVPCLEPISGRGRTRRPSATF